MNIEKMPAGIGSLIARMAADDAAETIAEQAKQDDQAIVTLSLRLADKISNYDCEYRNIPEPTLFELIYGELILEMPVLAQRAAAKIASLNMGKSPNYAGPESPVHYDADGQPNELHP